MLSEKFSVDESGRSPPLSVRGSPFSADDAPSVVVLDADRASLATANLARAVNFYARVFEFRLAANGGGRPRRAVLRSGRVRLALEERAAVAAEPGRASFVVEDLDAARERVWNLGIATTQVGAKSRGARPGGSSRWFAIRDPDGREIEVVGRGRP
jgi:predicted enzyme related to lactoylglutathione lyase